jgi:hypothetical protein
VETFVAIQRYGSKDRNGRLGMYYTMGVVRYNSSSLFLYIANDFIEVGHTDGVTIAQWKLDDIVK